MDIHFEKLTQPTPEIAAAFSKWENDPVLIPLTRPNLNEADLLSRKSVTVEDLMDRLKHSHMYLIYAGDELVGEMDYKVDPAYVYKKVAGTAWIGITIGEESGRGKGIGRQALRHLEGQIKSTGLKRIELGVFEFNSQAIKLYQKASYKEIARIEDFTFWQGRMWQDIRMEKYL
ncbi:MAG TPA: GNAT family N-acetyltransferase [Anaerolineales bacterium]|nr:GNAT family N-acetyltransferase [Anaerolineales bacterium]